MKDIEKYKYADDFLADVKKNKVTYEKLKGRLFGKQAIVFIKVVRKHGQKCWKDMCKYHELRYMANVGIKEALKP